MEETNDSNKISRERRTGEIGNARDLRISHKPTNLPIEDYLSAQGRFKHLAKDDLDRVKKEIDRNWDELKGREAQT